MVKVNKTKEYHLAKRSERLEKLLQGIDKRTASVGVIGLGYVGLPLVIEFIKAGFSVRGFDLDEKKIRLLKQGKSYISIFSLKRFFP